MKAYEYVIIRHPTKKEKNEGAVPTLFAEPKTVLAHDEQQAKYMAINDYFHTADQALSDEEIRQLEVLVRPFSP